MTAIEIVTEDVDENFYVEARPEDLDDYVEPLPEEVDKALYAKTVKMVRKADESIGDAKWAIGDAVLALAPMGKGFANNGSYDVIEHLAADTYVEFDSLSRYRQIASIFPPRTRVLGVSWSVHRELASSPDLLEGLIEVAEQQEDYTGPGCITVSWARDFLHDVRTDEHAKHMAEWAEKAEKVDPKPPKMPTERPEHIEVTAYVDRSEQVPEGVRISKVMSVWNHLHLDRFAGVTEEIGEVAGSLNDQERSELLRRLDLVEQQVKARFARMRKDLTPQVPRVR